MLFNSIEFLYFIFLFYLFTVLFSKYWKIIFIIFSAIFYSFWNKYFLIIFYIIGFQGYLFSWLITRYRKKSRLYTFISITISILILCFFKYGNYFINDLKKILNLSEESKIVTNILIPVGISFYTFQIISYVIDINNGKFYKFAFRFIYCNFTNDNINLSLFLTLITSSVVITRIFINFFKTILIGNSDQIIVGKLQLTASFFKIIIFILFLLFFQSIKELLIAYFLGFATELLLYSLVIFKKFKINLLIYKDYKLTKNYYTSLKNISLFSLSLVIFFNVDRILLSYKSLGDIIGEYNFIKTILLGFFIISGGYFYTLLPDLSKVLNNNLIKDKIIKIF
jgi:hypothetical protein